MMHLVLSGTPYEIGYQHGKTLRVLVDAMARYESRRHAHVAADPLDLDAVRESVSRAAPSLLEELQGIADGSRLPFDLLLEVNLRILHYCTVIAFSGSDEGPLLGKNLDFPVYAYQVVLTVQPSTGHTFTHIGCAGSIASYGGLNAAGLAMGHAAIPLAETPERGGLPVSFVRRLALQYCATTSEAIASVSSYDAWQMGDNLLFLDRAGDAACVEMQPGEQRIRAAKKGVLWCSNCFADMDPAVGNEEGRGRYQYLASLFKSRSVSRTREGMHHLLSSHNSPYPLCRDSTQLSFVASPVSGCLEIADGYPCQVGYRVLQGAEGEAKGTNGLQALSPDPNTPGSPPGNGSAACGGPTPR